MSTLLSNSSYCNSCGNYHQPGRSPTLLEQFYSPFAASSNHMLRDVLNLAGALQRQDSVTSLTVDKNKFQANFDVKHFKPEEITVKITGDNSITIEAKHEEKQDAHGQVLRHFVRRYVLPKSCAVDKMESRLSSDGVLTITAPTVGEMVEERVIPISKTGQPAKSLEKNKN